MPKPINISASRGAAILGLSKWRTPVQVWLEIMEGRQPGFCEKNKFLLPEFEYTSAMKWGHAFESAIIELAEGKRGDTIAAREHFSFYGKTGEHGYITCHIDGAYSSSMGTLHEGKTTSIMYYRDNFGEPGTDQVPIEYQIQCQHQMICTGAEKVILSVLVFPKRVEEWEEMGIEPVEMIGGQYRFSGEFQTYSILQWAHVLNQMGYFHQYEINAHPELQQQMIKAYTEFWNENVLKEMPPEPKSYDDIKALVREPVGTIVADENLEYLVSEYKQIKSEISGTGPLAKRADDIKVEVLNKMNESEHVLDDDSKDKYILRDRAGKKIASYGKNKNGVFVFR